MDEKYGKERFLTALVALAQTCGMTLSEFLIERYDENLRSFGYFRVALEVAKLVDNPPANRRMPSPGEIKARLGGGDFSANEEELARDAVGRIKNAVSRFGYPNWAEAEPYIGSLGTQIVRIMGGWDHVCNYNTDHDLDIALAQAREWAKVHIKKDRAGIAHVPPSLPSETEGRGYALAVVKQLAASVSKNKLLKE